MEDEVTTVYCQIENEEGWERREMVCLSFSAGTLMELGISPIVTSSLGE